MTNWTEWFRSQLKSSAEGFVWAFQQIEPSLHYILPPDPGYLGTWPPARLVWHVTEYERCLVLPSMQQWLGGAIPDGESWDDSDEAWSAAKTRTANELVAAFNRVRQEQIQLLDPLATVDWTSLRTTLWGEKPLSMIVTKTYQHTFEHGDTLLRMGLWWREIEEMNARQAQ